MPAANDHIGRVFNLVSQMLALADDGQATAVDDGCRLLYSVIQDSAYKIRQEAEREQRTHQSGQTNATAPKPFNR